MSLESPELQPGIKILHPELGEGVVVGREPHTHLGIGFLFDPVAAFFGFGGEIGAEGGLGPLGPKCW